MVYDNGEMLLGKAKDIKDCTKKLYEDKIIDEEFYLDTINELKDLNDTDIVTINYDNGMGIRLDWWTEKDIIYGGN